MADCRSASEEAAFEGVESRLGDDALALGEAGEEVRHVREAAVRTSAGRARLHRLDRRLQGGVGVERDGEAEILQLADADRAGVLPPMTTLTSWGFGSLAMACISSIDFRRLDEDDVGACFRHGVGALDARARTPRRRANRCGR